MFTSKPAPFHPILMFYFQVYPDLKNIVCPKAYKSPLGKAKYKARALDYFRYHVSLGSYDWILHMDEESVCDGETIRRSMEFVRYTPHHFGQGIILYNGEGYCASPTPCIHDAMGSSSV